MLWSLCALFDKDKSRSRLHSNGSDVKIFTEINILGGISSVSADLKRFIPRGSRRGEAPKYFHAQLGLWI